MARMSFAEINAAAEEMKRTHHERQAAITRAHFERHPECRRAILRVDKEGNAIRAKVCINVEARCQPGWFTNWMARSHHDEQRPMEAMNCAPEEEMKYRVVVEPVGKREQHLPDRNYGIVDMPVWLKDRYMPALQESYRQNFPDPQTMIAAML